MDRTIIYYTCNREDEGFEEKIRKKLIELCGDIPIISVSHKPIKLGKNICIGIHKPSNVLLYHQLLMGCREATTPFIINAEADFLYPPEYFDFTPPTIDRVYRYNHIRVLWRYHGGFYRKLWSEGAQIIGREYLLSLLEQNLKDIPMDAKLPGDNRFHIYRRQPLEMYGGDLAAITFKTGNSLHKSTGVINNKYVGELPFWGTSGDIRKEMFNS